MYSTSFYLGQNRELSEENDTTSYKHKCVTRNLARDMQITPISFFGSIFIKAQLRRFCSVCTEAPPIDLRMCVFFSISCSCRRENVENMTKLDAVQNLHSENETMQRMKAEAAATASALSKSVAAMNEEVEKAQSGTASGRDARSLQERLHVLQMQLDRLDTSKKKC